MHYFRRLLATYAVQAGMLMSALSAALFEFFSATSDSCDCLEIESARLVLNAYILNDVQLACGRCTNEIH